MIAINRPDATPIDAVPFQESETMGGFFEKGLHEFERLGVRRIDEIAGHRKGDDFDTPIVCKTLKRKHEASAQAGSLKPGGK